MTTLAKVEANRRNSTLSTGPRTEAGKLIVTRNPIKHGIFARLPIVPGEDSEAWDQHREGILASLSPVGLLEVTLAERVALLLWQLARLARYQAASITAAIEDANLPPSDADPFATALFPVGRREDEHLKLTEQNLRMGRKDHSELLASAEMLRRLDADCPRAIPSDLTTTVLQLALAAVEDYPLRRKQPLHYIEPEFLKHIDAPLDRFHDVLWTGKLLGTALDYYADAAGESPAVFRRNVQSGIDGRIAGMGRHVKRLEEEVAAIIRRSERSSTRAAEAALLPPEQLTERMMRYEKHLHGLLTSTIHELERLQSRRGGTPVMPPQVAELNVLVNGDLLGGFVS